MCHHTWVCSSGRRRESYGSPRTRDQCSWGSGFTGFRISGKENGLPHTAQYFSRVNMMLKVQNAMILKCFVVYVNAILMPTIKIGRMESRWSFLVRGTSKAFRRCQIMKIFGVKECQMWLENADLHVGCQQYRSRPGVYWLFLTAWLCGQWPHRTLWQQWQIRVDERLNRVRGRLLDVLACYRLLLCCIPCAGMGQPEHDPEPPLQRSAAGNI